MATSYPICQPVWHPDPAPATGTITAADAASSSGAGAGGQTLITGTATAGSTVSAWITGAACFAVSVSGTWAGTLQFEQASDNGTTWVPVSLTAMAGTASSTTAGNGVWQGVAGAVSHVRVRCTAYTSGTPTVTIQPGFGAGVGGLLGSISATVAGLPGALGQAAMAASLPVVLASNQTGVPVNAGTNLNTSLLALEAGGNLAAILADTADIEANTANIPPLGQAAMAASVPVAIASNQGAVPVSGTFFQATQPVSIAAAVAVTAAGNVNDAGTDTVNNVERVEQQFSYANISTAATTVVKSGAGLLHAIVINTRSAAGMVVVYDNTAGSGTKIATIDTTLSTTAFLYDCKFTTGLCLVTTDGGVTHADLTVTYR